MSHEEVIASGIHEEKEWRLKRFQDPDVDNPRTFNPMWTLVMNHRRRNLGDLQLNGEGFAAYKKEHRLTAKNCIELPVYAYEHGGIAFSLSQDGQFSDRFDAGQIGVAFLKVSALKKEYGADTEETRQKARGVLEGELETYQQYIEGETYGFTYEERPVGSEDDDDWAEEDSCGGFFGADPAENGMLDHLSEHVRNTIRPPQPAPEVVEEVTPADPAPSTPRRRRAP